MQTANPSTSLEPTLASSMTSTADKRQHPFEPISFNDMPNDVIGEIFKLLANDMESGRRSFDQWQESELEFHGGCQSATVLLRVCRSWTEIASDYPTIWSSIRVVVARIQNPNPNHQAILVHNQAEVDSLTKLAGAVPIKLSFTTSSRVRAGAQATVFRIGGLLEKVSSLLLDVQCARLLTTFSCLWFPNLSTVHIGDGVGSILSGYSYSQELSDFVGARFWMSGVQELVWSSINRRVLQVGLRWEGLTIFRVPSQSVVLSEWDVLTLLRVCKSLKTLACCFTHSSKLPGMTNMSETVVGPMPPIIVNDSLESLLLAQMFDNPHSSTTRLLQNLQTRNLKRVVVEHSHSSRHNQSAFLTNPATVASVTSLELAFKAVGLVVIKDILRAMPCLITLKLTPFDGRPDWDSSYITYGPGMEDAELQAIAETARNLEFCHILGESWLTANAVTNFIEMLPRLKVLSIEVWGGVGADTLDLVRMQFPQLRIQCGMVALCWNNAGHRPRMVELLGWGTEGNDEEEVSPQEPRIKLSPPVLWAQTKAESDAWNTEPYVVCSLCRSIHVGEVIDSNVSARPVSRCPVEYV